MSNYGFVTFDGDHSTDLIETEHARCEPKHYLGAGADDGIEFSAVMGPYFDPRSVGMDLDDAAINGYPDGRWPPGGGPAREESREGNEQPFGTEAVASWPADHQWCRPTDETFDGAPQVGAPLREAIHDVPIVVAETAFDHASCFQVAEPVCEQVRRDARKALGELSVARWSDQELTNDQ
ncbi:hypothetical protein ACNUDN_00092 [Mycobacterium sp. smrl_JER01]